MTAAQTPASDPRTQDPGPSPRTQVIPLDAIGLDLPNHRHPSRHDETAIDELAASMQAHGQKQAIEVCEPPEWSISGARYVLVFGHRRLEAAKQLGWETIRAEVNPPMDRAAILTDRAIENLHRQDIDPIEEVIAVDHLLRRAKEIPPEQHAELVGRDILNYHQWVGSQIGKTERWVRDRDYLSRLTPAVKALALATRIPAGHLREIAKIADPELQAAIASNVVRGSSWGLTPSASLIDPHAKELKPPKDGYQKRWFDEVMAAAAEGSHRYMTLEDVRGQVAQAQRSLKSVPWDFEARFTSEAGAGGVELPACQGCPHNSETDQALFGVEPDPKNPRGICHNPGCFAQKTALADAAKEKLKKRFGRRKNPPTAEEVREHAPDWLKESTAKRAVKKAVKSKDDQGATNSTRDPYGHLRRTLTEHEKALNAFAEALQLYIADLAEKIYERASSEPAKWAAFCVLVRTQAWHDRPEGWDVPRAHEFLRSPTTSDPEGPQKMQEATADAIKLAAWAATGDHVIELAKLPLGPDHTDAAPVPTELSEYAGEKVLKHYAHHLGLEPREPPTWADFDPKTKADAETPKPEPKSKPKRKPKSAQKPTASQDSGPKTQDPDASEPTMADRRAGWGSTKLEDVLSHAGASFHGLGTIHDGEHNEVKTLGDLADVIVEAAGFESLEDTIEPPQRLPGLGPKLAAKFIAAARDWFEVKRPNAVDLAPCLKK